MDVTPHSLVPSAQACSEDFSPDPSVQAMAEVLYVLNVVAMWMYQCQQHTDLVALTQTCRAFLPRVTEILDRLDQTVRVASTCDDGMTQV